MLITPPFSPFLIFRLCPIPPAAAYFHGVNGDLAGGKNAKDEEFAYDFTASLIFHVSYDFITSRE